MKVIDEDHFIQYKGAGEGVKVGLNQKTSERRKNRYVNNKRFKSKTTKGMLERVLLMISFKGDS